MVLLKGYKEDMACLGAVLQECCGAHVPDIGRQRANTAVAEAVGNWRLLYVYAQHCAPLLKGTQRPAGNLQPRARRTPKVKDGTA